VITYDGTGPAWDAFSRRYAAKFGVPPQLANCLYSACEAYGQAMKNANSADKEKVMQALRAPDFKVFSKSGSSKRIIGSNIPQGVLLEMSLAHNSLSISMTESDAILTYSTGIVVELVRIWNHCRTARRSATLKRVNGRYRM
jgi:hypothetical protein